MENKQFEEDRLFFVNQVGVLINQKMFPEALKLAKDRLSRFPSDIDAKVFVNLTLIAMGNIEESRDIVHELEKDIARLSFGYLQAADAYQEKGLDRDALLCYRKFLSLNPFADNSGEVAEKIAWLQEEENLFDESTEADNTDTPGPEFYTLTLAELYIKQGHTRMAVDILTEILNREPGNVPAKKKLDALKANLASKSSSGDDAALTNSLINTLSCWLDNIDRLKTHAT